MNLGKFDQKDQKERLNVKHTLYSIYYIEKPHNNNKCYNEFARIYVCSIELLLTTAPLMGNLF